MTPLAKWFGKKSDSIVPRLTPDGAIGIAKLVAVEQTWTWREPAEARLLTSAGAKPPVWEVISNAGSTGCSVKVRIDDTTGAVIEKAFLPR